MVPDSLSNSPQPNSMSSSSSLSIFLSLSMSPSLSHFLCNISPSPESDICVHTSLGAAQWHMGDLLVATLPKEKNYSYFPINGTSYEYDLVSPCPIMLEIWLAWSVQVLCANRGFCAFISTMAMLYLEDGIPQHSPTIL